jgi:DNA polymerase
MPNIVTLDFETFYDRQFSLSKITTEEYVRSPLFETIGVGIKVNDAPAWWYPQPQVEAALAAIDWSDTFVLCQNTAFDAAILSWRYRVNPRGWLDTLGMSRALYPHEKSHSLKSQAERLRIGVKGEEVIAALGMRYKDFGTEALRRYGDYCENDCELTYKLFQKYMATGFPRQELELIDLTLRMFVEPKLVLDTDALRKHLAAVKEHKLMLMETVRDMMLADADPDFTHAILTEGIDGIRKLLMSNDKFAEVLRKFGVEPPMKVSKTTGKPAYAFAKTDEEFKALEDHDDPDVQGLVAARLGNKTTLEETRTERFIHMAARGAFPVPLRYYGAHSGRWSGQDSVNLQNLPSRGPSAGKIKKAILAPPGYVVIDCDSSQIEARTLAWLAGQDDLVQAFENKEDVYKIMASKIYSVPVDQIDKQQRQVGKTVILGAGYGVGHPKLQAFLKMQAGVTVSLDEAKRLIDTYRSTYYKIPELWKKADAGIRALASGQAMQIDVPGVVNVVPGKGLTLPNGLFIQYPDLRRVTYKSPQGEEKPQWAYVSKGLPVHVYGGKCVENFCQGIARVIIGEQMLRIAKRYQVVLTVHDAVAVVAKQEEAAQAQAFVEECMSWRPKWAQGLPLACESGMGASYGDC